MMRYNQQKHMFYFEKDQKFVDYLLQHVQNGVLKEYPAFYVLEPLPEVLQKQDYDLIIIDGEQVKWEELFRYTNDRVKRTVEQRFTTENEKAVIDRFYSRIYNENHISMLFKQYEDAHHIVSNHTFTQSILGFELINLRI